MRLKEWMIDHTVECMSGLLTCTAFVLLGVWCHAGISLSNETRDKLEAETNTKLAVLPQQDPADDDAVVPRMSRWGVAVQCCAWCGTSNGILQIHHIVPQHVRPDLAHCTNNMICLCRACHVVVGHRRNFNTGAVTNLLRVIEESRR